MTTRTSGITVPATVEGVYLHAWRLLVDRFWPLMALMGIWIVIQVPGYALSMAGSFAEERAPVVAIVLSLASSAWSLAIGLPAQYGVIRVLSRTARGLPTDVEEVFWPFRSLSAYGSCLGHALLLTVIVIAVMAPALIIGLVGGCGAALAAAQAPQDTPGALLAGLGLGMIFLMLVGMIPAVWVACRLLIGQSLVADAEVGPVDAIGMAWRSTRGHGLTAFLVMLASIPVMFAGCLALCVGLIPATALYMLALSSLYVALACSPAPEPPPAP